MEDCTMSFEFRRFRHAERGHGVYNGSTVGCTPSIGEYNDVARGDLAKFCEHSAAHRRNDSTLKSLCMRPGGEDRQSGVVGKSVSVHVDLGGSSTLKNKKNQNQLVNRHKPITQEQK